MRLQKTDYKIYIYLLQCNDISYLVKNRKYDLKKAIALFNEAVDKNNEAESLKDLQGASDYFWKNSYNAGIDYDNR